MRHIFRTIAGSRLHGTDLDGSDCDIRGVYIPPAQDILLQRCIESYKEHNGQFYALHKFMQMCLKGDMSSLELLFSNQNDLLLFDWALILNQREALFHREAIKKMISYARSQIRVDVGAYKRCEDLYPESYKNICKSSSHAIRMCEECIELHTDGRITLPRANADFLKKVKIGNVPHTKVTEILKERISQLETIVVTSIYPEKPGSDLIDRLVCDIYKKEMQK